ncbi:hypothetical protein [Microbacterium sp.]|uniref:hypothetical protein n=1 Tax=Microbacterium sp. TaxID=51671 RepID=UPI002E31C8AF|nr:hypothetical protein [Microbacterium sp.]HEX5731088.1 hypothetical protein [Microbacterium sp.]
MAGARPGGVTLVAVLAWISGAVNIIAGGLLIFAAIMAPDALWFGLVQFILGIITIVVSIGLLRGSSGARLVVTIVFVLNLISALVVIFFQQAQVWSGIVSGVVVLIGLVLLWTPRANEFFRR